MDLQAWGKKESQALTVPENTVCASEGPVGEATSSSTPVQPYFSLIAESYPQVPLALNSMTMTLGHSGPVVPPHSPLGPQLWGWLPSPQQRTQFYWIVEGKVAVWSHWLQG